MHLANICIFNMYQIKSNMLLRSIEIILFFILSGFKGTLSRVRFEYSIPLWVCF